MTGLIQRLVRYFVPLPVARVEDLKDLVARECAHISQKVPIDYVEARAHAFAPQLFTEKPFLDALHTCTRESYAAILGDLLILVEGALRPHAGPSALQVADRIAGLYGEILAQLDPPRERADGWGEATSEFHSRFDHARTHAPAPAADVVVHAGERMFRTLPLHQRFTRLDQDAIIATVQLRAAIFVGEFRRRLDASALVADLRRAR